MGATGIMNWRAVANDFQRAMFEREGVIEQMKEALEFLRCCEASGEAGADHPVVLHALGAANTRKPKPNPEGDTRAEPKDPAVMTDVPGEHSIDAEEGEG